MRLKNILSCMGIVGCALAYSGSYSTAMEEEERQGAAASGFSSHSPNADVKEEGLGKEMEKKLIKLFSFRGVRIDSQNLFFIKLPQVVEGEREEEPKTFSSRDYTHIKIQNENPDLMMVGIEKSSLEELGKKLLERLSKESAQLAWSRSLEGRYYPDGPFSDGSDIRSIHQFISCSGSREKSSGKVDVKGCLKEGLLAGRQLTTLMGKSRLDQNPEKKEISLHAERDFKPIRCRLTGLIYVTDPERRQVFILGLARSFLFESPQFIWIDEGTRLEERNWLNAPTRPKGQKVWRALESWIAVTSNPPAECCNVTYTPSSSVFEYNEDWWAQQVEGVPEYENLILFLRNFEESLLLRAKESGAKNQSIIVESPQLLVGEGSPCAFFQVLSWNSLPGGDYLYVDSESNLRACIQQQLQLREAGQQTSFAVRVYSAGGAIILEKNGDKPPVFSGFYRLSQQREMNQIQWFAPGGDLIHTFRDNLGVRYQKERAEAPLGQVLEAGRLSYLSWMSFERCLFSLDSIPCLGSIVEQSPHLRYLSFRECFSEKTLNRETSHLFFNVLRELINLEEFDFSGNVLEKDVFQSFFLTLLGGGPQNLRSISVSLPIKPPVDGKRATIGGALGTAAAAGGTVGILGGPPGIALGATVGAGGAIVGAGFGAISRKVAELSKKNRVSYWALIQIEPFMSMSSLQNLTVFGVRRSRKGCDETKKALESIRVKMDLPAINITLSP